MQPGTDGPRRHAERLRDLVERQADIVMKHEHGPLIHVEAAEAALELIAIEQAEVRVGFGRIERGDVDLHRPSALALAGLAMAGVDQQAVQPGVEAIRIAEPPDVAPGGDERLLGSILGAASSRRISRATTKSRPVETRASSANAS